MAAFVVCIAAILVIAYVLTRGVSPPTEVRNDPKVIAAYLGVADEDEALAQAEARP